VVNFTPPSLYPQGKRLQYSSDRRLGGPQSPSGHGGEKKHSHSPPGIETLNPDRPARRLVAIATELSRLLTFELMDMIFKLFHCFNKFSEPVMQIVKRAN
jgi:hypothetical protein